ncbi:MAG: ribosome maturation factor RimP [Deltaproteobacteria bacterium]|nr:ribosome maturation factor RimP [Deltaproteobacteria bacterium]
MAEPLANSLGLEVLWIEDVVERGQRILRFYMEAQEAKKEVNLEDCAKFSRLFSPLLEAESGIGEKYHLEISSPGLNRPLVKVKHFENHLGKIIKLVLQEPIAERKKMTARLVELKNTGEDFSIIVESEGKTCEVPFSKIKKANLDYFASEKNQ